MARVTVKDLRAEARRRLLHCGNNKTISRMNKKELITFLDCIAGSKNVQVQQSIQSKARLGLTVGQILRKPCGTLAVTVHVMTTHDSGNEHDHAWCKVKTADGGGEAPTPEQVKDWSAQFVAHGIGDRFSHPYVAAYHILV